MAIPKVTKEDIIKALNYIDEDGVPLQNQSTKYELVTADGKNYPPKYVIAVADHIANGKDISIDGFNAVEAKNFLQSLQFKVESKKFELTITADSVVSTDQRFNMSNLWLGDNYKPLDAYYVCADGKTIRRTYVKGNRKISNMTMPRILCQIYEKNLEGLSDADKENFPICKYSSDRELIKGIYSSVSEFKRHRNTIEFLVYSYGENKQFVFYSWNIFSTIIFVQECLKRFGGTGDKFILKYREKDEKEKKDKKGERETFQAENEDAAGENTIQKFDGYLNEYSSKLIESKNIIFRGAPGTGKSYLAKAIAADIISNGSVDKYELLDDEQKKQMEFVQFHPSYDYSDFVEGLRPKSKADGSMGFELKDGIFKSFVERARENYENSQKTVATIKKELSVQDTIEEFFSNIEFGVDTFETISRNKFTITNVDDERIYVYVPGNPIANAPDLKLYDLKKMLESDDEFAMIKDVKTFFGKKNNTQEYSYYFAIYKAIKATKTTPSNAQVKQQELKKYVFIIDEINRGEISKIFGELFFAVDPNYRGKNGAVSTQYANLHIDPFEKFYIPENVYIIGTMNDIDRSVESFDFAMRRRFRFIEIKANDNLQMLDGLEEPLRSEAIERMTALNNEIAAEDDLNENYQIGAAYFLKLKTFKSARPFDLLWTDYLKPLLQEYIQGMYDEKGIMKKFEEAYGYNMSDEGATNDNVQN